MHFDNLLGASQNNLYKKIMHKIIITKLMGYFVAMPNLVEGNFNKSQIKIPCSYDVAMNQVQIGLILEHPTKNFNIIHLPNGGCCDHQPFF
jgi:hypothetical protein